MHYPVSSVNRPPPHPCAFTRKGHHTPDPMASDQLHTWTRTSYHLLPLSEASRLCAYNPIQLNDQPSIGSSTYLYHRPFLKLTLSQLAVDIYLTHLRVDSLFSVLLGAADTDRLCSQVVRDLCVESLWQQPPCTYTLDNQIYILRN